MKTSSATCLLSALAAAALLTGCYTGDVYDHHHDHDPYHQGPRERDSSERHEHHAREVNGTVERVDDDEHTILLERQDGEPGLVLTYDDETTLEFQGQTYRPGKLEPGDLISAVVERTDEGLMAQAIRVLSDKRDDRRDRDDRERRDRGDRSVTSLRGVVRSTDAPNRILEIELSGSQGHDLIEVHYDDETVVEFQGHGYAAERLDQGDVVEVEIRGSGGPRMLAGRIVVVAEARPAGH